MLVGSTGGYSVRTAETCGRVLARLRWYGARLRAMSAAEILHRVREARAHQLWQGRPPGWDEGIGDGPIRTSAILRKRLRAAALPGVTLSADTTRSGRLDFLGRRWPTVDWQVGAGGEFWRHDPVTGRSWPKPPAAIDLRSTGTDPFGPGFGDAKFVWEPARLQMLQPLAAEGDAETALAILRSFAADTPPYGGVHWTSGIEIALRLVSLTLLCAGCDPERFAPADRILIRRFAAAHGAHLAAFPSLYSSANNHRMAEGLGLLLAGLLVPDLGPGWVAEGRTIIAEMVPRLVLADGGGAEQSPVYLAFVLEMAAFAVMLAAEAGQPLAPAVSERLARGAAFLKALLDGAGRAPAIGDDDETRVIAMPPTREPRYAASVVAAVAGVTGRHDLAPPDRDPHLRDVLFAAPAHGGTALSGLRTFPDAGLSTAHERLGDRAVHLVFDHGPLGYGTLAAHGHADALALWLSVDGEPVLVDAGTWLYFSAGPTRLRLRESGSHNSVTLHGASQSCASSAFGWSSRARATLLTATPGPNWSLTASHDGYRRRFGLDHLRRVSRTGDALILADRLTGGSAPAEIGFLLPLELEVAITGNSIAVGKAGRPLCRLRAPEGFAVALRRGAGQGAVRSPAFGEIVDAQRLVFTGLLGQAEAVTRLDFAPTTDGTMARESLPGAVP